MWNERYAKANKLPEPKDWQDLAKPVYFDHVSIAAPSRSGTTHLTIETILQGEGWEKGWRTIKEMAGNFRPVTERSFGVPEAVNSGQVGVGIVIDFFAFSAQASGFPVKFVYPTVTTIVPANVGIVANAPNKAAAEAFVEFLLSPAGQEVLLEPSIRRLPVNPAVYAKAPARLSQPLQGSVASAADDQLRRRQVSEKRTAVVDTLFDQLITFQLDGLKAATKAHPRGRGGAGQKGQCRRPSALAEGGARPDRRHAGQRGASRVAGNAGAFTGAKEKGARQAELESNGPLRARALRQGEGKGRRGLKPPLTRHLPTSSR